jgi:DNA-binding FadR family transcriptional regulator
LSGPVRASSGAAPAPRAKRLHDTVADRLGVAIVTGAYSPGDLLENEIQASGRLHVSRSAYREAVRMLAAKGLVESRPKTGTRVNPRRQWNLLDPQVLGWMFEGEVSREFLRDLFEMRMVVEPAAAELAAQRRNADDLARMGHALEEMARHGLGAPEGRAADQRFHAAILEATRNQTLVTLAGAIAAAVSWTTLYKQRHRELPRDALPDHRAVYLAIAEGDPAGARAAMTELVRLALQDTELSLAT